MQQTAADPDDGPDGTLCRPVCMMRIREGDLLHDAFIFVKHLERVGSKLSSSVMASKLDLLLELSLDLYDVVPDTIFALGLGSQTEALPAAAFFVYDQ